MEQPQESVHRALGRLEGKTEALGESMSQLHAELKALSRRGDEHREQMNETLAEFRKAVQDMGQEVAAMKAVPPAVEKLEANMARVLPLADNVTKWRWMVAGIFITITFIGSIFSSVILDMKMKLVKFFFGS